MTVPTEFLQLPLRQQVKAVADQLRLILVVKLASWIIDVAPKTPEGTIWIDAIGKGAVDSIVHITTTTPNNKLEEWSRRMQCR